MLMFLKMLSLDQNLLPMQIVAHVVQESSTGPPIAQNNPTTHRTHRTHRTDLQLHRGSAWENTSPPTLKEYQLHSLHATMGARQASTTSPLKHTNMEESICSQHLLPYSHSSGHGNAIQHTGITPTSSPCLKVAPTYAMLTATEPSPCFPQPAKYMRPSFYTTSHQS
jgi:hypothetical protein